MGRATLNLVFALVWLVMGAVLLLRAWLNPDDYSQWVGWLALGMFGYNLARWWLARSATSDIPPSWPSARRRSGSENPESSFRLEDEPLPPETR